MIDLETKIEADAPEFADELFDEALDQEGGFACFSGCGMGPVAGN